MIKQHSKYKILRWIFFGAHILGRSSKKNGLFTVRLTVRGWGEVSPLGPDRKQMWKFWPNFPYYKMVEYKSKYVNLFWKKSQRSDHKRGGSTLTVSLTVKIPSFFYDDSLISALLTKTNCFRAICNDCCNIFSGPCSSSRSSRRALEWEVLLPPHPYLLCICICLCCCYWLGVGNVHRLHNVLYFF